MASLDPLDRELFQRAFDAVRSVLKADELDSDEKLEAALRCELLTIALLNGMSDPLAEASPPNVRVWASSALGDHWRPPLAPNGLLRPERLWRSLENFGLKGALTIFLRVWARSPHCGASAIGQCPTTSGERLSSTQALSKGLT